MKNKKGYVLIGGLLALLFWLAIIGSWIGNVYKLLDCNFEPSYKGEIIHGIGLVPVLSLFTVWNDDK